MFFFMSNTFISTLARAKQHLEAELLLFETFLFSSSKLPSKNIWRYSQKYTKTKTSASLQMKLFA